MALKSEQVESIFCEARLRPTAAERGAYLDGACGNDAALRVRVEGLLRCDEQAGNFLKTEGAETLSLGPTESRRDPVGTCIGPYKLLQIIGEGGMGVVYMAQQQRPVVRMVALKMITVGMDTRSVVARFEAERQALALMDHPNIAKVLDAGATEAGRPYFVMELVKGVSITAFCNDNKLTTNERLDLFTAVCAAVQHAHQKGIIHRDLKPTNILVTMHDDKAVPKIIDFGVAKATQSRLTEKTLFTEFKQMIGTPAYMSPEQAQMSGLDVDTRSDIYSLGVLLYELLTGTTPFDGKALRSAAYDEMRRIIREVEPPSPSVRLSTLGGAELTSIADHRRSDPRALQRTVRGDLDWIVMKCLEKDRTRRYEFAGGLARDIQRYLAQEAVEARPAGAGYRARKFVQRHKAGVAAAVVVAAALVLGVSGTSWGLVRARLALGEAQKQREFARDRQQEAERQRKLADEQRVEADRQKEMAIEQKAEAELQRKQATEGQLEAQLQTARAEAEGDFLKNLLRGATPESPGGKDAKVAEILDAAGKTLEKQFAGQPEVEIPLRQALAESYSWQGRDDQALDHLRKAYLLATSLPEKQSRAAMVEIGGDFSRELASRGNFDESHRILDEALQFAVQIYGETDPHTVDIKLALAGVLNAEKKDGEAEAIFQQIIDRSRDKTPGYDADRDSSAAKSNAQIALNNLAILYKSQGKLTEAQTLLREASAIEGHGLEDAGKGGWRIGTNLASMLRQSERYGEARDILEKALPEMRKKLGDTYDEVLSEEKQYAVVLQQLGAYPEFLATCQDLVAKAVNARDKFDFTFRLGDAYALNGQDALAASTSVDALKQARIAKMNTAALQGYWRGWELRGGLGGANIWKNLALRAQVWSALNDFLDRAPPKTTDDLRDLSWEGLSFSLRRWDAAAEGSLRVEEVGKGGLKELRAVGPLEEGEYVLTMDAPRAGGTPMHLEDWLTFPHWNTSLYRITEWYPGDRGGPRDWQELIGSPDPMHRVYDGLAVGTTLTPDAGPGGDVAKFGLVAISTLQVPAGRYRLVVSGEDGVRVDLDGRRVVDSWMNRDRSTDDAICDLAGGQHTLRVEYYKRSGPFNLWLRLEPQAPQAVAALGGAAAESTYEMHLRELTQLMEKEPQNMTRVFNRGIWYARHGRFAEAARDFDAVPVPDANGRMSAWFGALIHLQMGDEEGYLSRCHTLLKTPVSSFIDQNNFGERLAKVCALVPGAFDMKEAKARLAVPADTVNDAVTDAAWLRFRDLAQGMVHYRAGEWQLAAEALVKSYADGGNNAQAVATAYFFEAMARHQLGDQAKAKEMFDRGIRLADAETSPRADLGEMPDWVWTDWIVEQRARQEAEVVFGGIAAQPNAKQPTDATRPENASTSPSRPSVAQKSP